MGTRQMTPFFPSTSVLWIFVTFISEFKNTQNSCPIFGPFWPVKSLDFWPEATNLDSSSYFSRK